MKKFVAALLCLMMLLSLFSCDRTEDKNISQTDPEAPKESENNDTVPSETEKTMEIYKAVINGELCVVDENLGETKLKSLRFPSNDTSLDECKLLTKAIFDIDQDGNSEYVIQSPDNEYIILRYYNAKVYSYYLYSCDFYNFNTDGTFYWCNSPNTVGMECGLSKIIFDGEKLNTKSIYSLKYSSKYEYFVEGEAVTEDEYYDYRSQIIHKDEMKFSQFELTHLYPITAEQAWNLANAYWDNQDGRSECSAGTNWTARIELIDTPSSETNYYRVAFKVEWSSNGGGEGDECKPPHSIHLHDQILVNAFTGEITTPACESGSKCISVEEAIEIAKNHEAYMNGDTYDKYNEENGYRFELDVNEAAPDHIYVIVVLKYDTDHYSFHTRTWIDKYTGETVFSYYVNGKG